MKLVQLTRAAMAERGVPALLVSHIGNVQWLTGFTGSFGFVVLTQDRAVFLSDSRYTIQAQEQVHGFELVSYASPRSSDELLAEIAKDLGVTQLGFESQQTTYDAYQAWVKAFPGVELVPAGNLLSKLRMVKTDEEVKKIRQACHLADACFDHVRRLIQPGVTEYDLNLEIEFFFRRHQAALAFEPIVVSGPNSARPHGKATEKKLEAGDFVTMDFGAKLAGYCSDITRTVVIGEPTDKHRQIYNLVLEAQLACLDAMKPGALAKDVDAVARTIFGRDDMAQYFGHGLGHGLGRDVHDVGRMNPTSTDVLAEGQVWTVEPGVYLEGFGGVRIEDDVVVSASGIEILTSSPKELLTF